MERRNILMYAMISCLAQLAAGQEIWTNRSQWLSCTGLNGIAYANGRYVAVGMAGAVALSSDGRTWTNQPSGSRCDLLAVTYGDSQFIALGSAGAVLTSTDGTAWIQRQSGTKNRLVNLAYGNNLFVAVGDSGTTLSSADGVAWTPHPLRSSLSCRKVIFGNGVFVALVNDSNSLSYDKYEIFTSPDGSAWTSRVSQTSGACYAICYGNDRFITLGNDSYTSSDGIIWTKSKGATVYGPMTFDDLLYVNHQFIAVGSQQPTNTLSSLIYTSSDGETWTEHLGASGRFHSIVYGNNQFVVVGAITNRNNTPLNSLISTSIDGTTWTPLSLNESPHFRGVEYFDKVSDNQPSQFIAFGSTSLSSLDGISWSKIQTDQINPVAFIVYGKNTAVGGGTGGIYTSSDFQNWTQRYSTSIHSIAFGQDKFIAVGRTGFINSDTLLTSSDGITWIKTNTEIPIVASAMAYTGNQFIAVGSTAIITSPDGTAWTKRTSGTDYSLNNIACSSTMPPGQAGRIIVVGTNGTILSSADGVAWEKKTSGTTCSLFGITYGNNNFVAVGDSGTILSSPDGASWTIHNSGTGLPLKDICFANNLFAAVGEDIILTSPAKTTAVISPGRNARAADRMMIVNNNLRYTLSSAGAVSIKLYDLRGRFVKTLVNSIQPVGLHMVPLPRESSPGAYILSFHADQGETENIVTIGR